METEPADRFASALQHAIVAGKHRAEARCDPIGLRGLTKVSDFHHAVAARMVEEWLEEMW